MDRDLASLLQRDIGKKIVIVTGPRQSGKTWLATHLDESTEYLSFDDSDHRQLIRERTWDRRAKLLVLDELHKMPQWKSYLKGVYDVEGMPPGIVVTGSARLSLHRRTGESLAGRFFQYRLHPFDVRELGNQMDPRQVLERILLTGGFPEPFLHENTDFYLRWRRSHLDVILRQDLLDLVTVSDIKSLELLVDLLRERVGSPISSTSLGRDLQKDPKTIKRWLEILEELYVIFPVRPWHRNIARAVLKEPKYYFFDTGQVADRPGMRLENAVACSLLKALHYAEDTDGRFRSLAYIRTRDGKEIDFALVQDGKVTHLIEVKEQETKLSPSFVLVQNVFSDAVRVQLVRTAKREMTWPTGEELREAASYLASLDLSAH